MKVGIHTGVFIIVIGMMGTAVVCSTPTVRSPHCQNEMMSPYAHDVETHELTGAVAYNKWVIPLHGDTNYVQTYPRGSLSLVHCAYINLGSIDGFGGVELINAPTEWWDEEVSGIIGIVRPYLGMQCAWSYTTTRLNIAPFNFFYGVSREGSGGAPVPAIFTWYQITMLLHNPPDALHHVWCGVRGAPGGSGLLGGAELMRT